MPYLERLLGGDVRQAGAGDSSTGDAGDAQGAGSMPTVAAAESKGDSSDEEMLELTPEEEAAAMADVATSALAVAPFPAKRLFGKLLSTAAIAMGGTVTNWAPSYG
jgi:hypothetical protein